jgi:hypothetical protein
MTALTRQRAREIVCDAFNHFTDLKLEPTVEGEKANINSTLKQIDEKFRIAIHGTIVSNVHQEGCTTFLGVAGFITARYKTVRSVVNDVVALTNCPE